MMLEHRHSMNLGSKWFRYQKSTSLGTSRLKTASSSKRSDCSYSSDSYYSQTTGDLPPTSSRRPRTGDKGSVTTVYAASPLVSGIADEIAAGVGSLG